MADEQVDITEADMQSMADKFEAFSAGLSPIERAALVGLMGAAGSGGEETEVSGFQAGKLGSVQGIDQLPGSIKIGGGIAPQGPLEAVSVGVGGYCVFGEWSR